MSAAHWLLLAALAAMALVIRAVGSLAGTQLARSPVARAFLDAVPGTMLVALVVPEIASRGAEGLLAATATVAVMLVSKNVAWGMCAGIAATLLWRNFAA